MTRLTKTRIRLATRCLFSFTLGLVFVLVGYLAYLKVTDMYHLINMSDARVHHYCMGVRRWGMDEVCHCYEIHGRVCYGDRAVGSDVYKQELLREARDGS